MSMMSNEMVYERIAKIEQWIENFAPLDGIRI